jgi:hypothetical protein
MKVFKARFQDHLHHEAHVEVKESRQKRRRMASFEEAIVDHSMG